MPTRNDDITDGIGDYHVVLLVEQELGALDAAQVRALHDGIEDRVVYHVLIPLEDAAARIEASMGSLSAGEMLASPAMTMRDVDLDAVRKDCKDRSDRELKATLDALEAAGATVGTGTVIAEPPIDALATQGHRGRRPRGDHPDPLARGLRVLPPRLDLPGPPQDRRPGAAPARARELRRAGGRRRGRHGRLGFAA